MKKMDNPIINIYGNDNKVEVNIIVPETSPKISVAVIITIATIIVASILTVSLCCPELLTDFIRLIVSVAIGC